MPGKSYIKVGAYDWDRIKKMYVKTGGQTWTAIRKAYVKTSSGWRKVFDTASNRPFIQGNDIPKIRLNTFRTDSTYNPTGTIDDPVNPVIEAPPVQQMGPAIGSQGVPTYGWPNEAIGRHLWGYDGDWVSGNGSAMTFVYTWLYNLSGNQNDNIAELNATSTTGRTDMLTNLSSHLGQSDGDYFDRNFLTFRVSATNSAGTASAESTQVYIVRQRPTGAVTMIEPSVASPNNIMSATFTYSNNWFNKTDTAESYVEWFAVDNLGDTLTTSNRVQIEYLNTFTATGTTTKSATTFHTPTLTNKYYYARITLNNSNTLPAKFNGSVINVSGFTPNSAFTAQANKDVKTVSANGPFNLTNAVKTARYYDSATQTWRRYVSVDIGQSSSADRYEVQIEGQYSGTSGTYDLLGSSSWVVLQSFFQSPYVMESSRIGGVLTHTATVFNYLNYRVTARSLNGTSTNGAAYSNNGTSTSFQYVIVPAVAPSAPSISNIQTSSDFFGSFVTFDIYVSSNGSNELDYFQYSLDNGSNWQTNTNASGYINSTLGKIYVTPGSTVNLRIRATNLDGATSSQSNLLSITAFVQPSAPTSVVVRSFSSNQGTLFFTSGSNTQSVEGFLEYDSFNAFDSISGYVNVNSNTAAKIQLTGANSTTRSYTAYLRPYSGQNKTGGSGTITSYTTKVLNGSDLMSVTLGTPTRPSDRTISLSWALSSGAPTHYICRLYNFSTGSIISTKTVTSTTTSISFNSSDGVQYSTVYYIGIQPQYQYTSSVTYEDLNFVSTNINSGANLTAPTSTSIVSMSRLTDTTVRAQIGSSGGSGPYYQLYWISSTTAPVTANYDAAGTTSTVTEDQSFGNGTTVYFYMRSSSENLGNTVNFGTATDGTYSAYGPSTGAASYTFASPTGGSASVSGSSSVGSTLTLSLGTPSASPSAVVTSIIWRVNDGGTGGNSFTGGSTLQTGGTTFVIPQFLYASVSSVGYQIRAEVTWNNGVGSQSANSGATTVTAAAVAPSNTSTPTLSPTSIAVGTVLTAGVGSWSGTTPITYDLRIYRGTANVSTGETLVRSAGNVTSTTYTVTQADFDSGQRYFRTYVNATNTAGSSGFVAGQERGPIATPVSAPTNTSQPTLSGSLSVGSVVTFGVGSWSGSPTSYDLRLYRGTQFVSSGETLVKSAGNVTSSTYTITQADFNSGQRYLRAFASATNAGGTSSLVSGQEIGPITSAPATPAPVLSSITGNNSLAVGGTFSWSFTNSPTSYSVFCTGPNGTVFTTNNAYTYTGTTFRPGYDGTGWQGAGNYTIFVSARNAGGDSAVASVTTFMN